MIRLLSIKITLLLFVIFNVNGTELTAARFHSLWNPPETHCKLAQLHLKLTTRDKSITPHLTNAGNCKYFEGDIYASISLWTEAYTMGRDETLLVLARVSSLLESKPERELGGALLHAYSNENKTHKYQLPLFKALQIIAFEPRNKANELLTIENLALAFELETKITPTETFHFISYLQDNKYFNHSMEEAEVLFTKLTPWKNEIRFSECFIAEALEFDIYKLPSTQRLKNSYKEKCSAQQVLDEN